MKIQHIILTLLITASCAPAPANEYIETTCNEASTIISQIMTWHQYERPITEVLDLVGDNESLVWLVRHVYSQKLQPTDTGKQMVIQLWGNEVYERCVDTMMNQMIQEGM
jgi:hypothetical protein